ncbi:MULTISPECIES: hypothetical protein [unclassified Prevotella]|uniref:hypothetical protein n=1 Tax=unclassified Prevotella TaxID=2638335 RepID=UPI000BCDB9E7|nr:MULTISPECIES: hypothetical protein [unclassified Prevotella]OYP45017.1 hypothetical protein CIK96_09945 [Prevotella sp. P4-98]
MKKIGIMMLLCMLAIGVKAQEERCPLHFEGSFYMGVSSKDLTFMGENIDFGYSPINRLSIHALAHSEFFIPKIGAIIDSNIAVNLGGGIGYQLLNNKNWRMGTLELRGTLTTSLGSSSSTYKNTSYGVGLYFYKHSNAQRFQPVIGIGFNVRNFHGNVPNFYGPYVSLGIRF